MQELKHITPLFTDAQAQTIVDRGYYKLLVFIERHWAINLATLLHDGKLDAVEEYESTAHLRRMSDRMFIEPEALTYEAIAPWWTNDFDKNHLQSPENVK
jgi:hypothetical protein